MSSGESQHKASVTDVYLCPVVSFTVIRNSSNTSREFACLACFGKRGLSSCGRRLCSNFLLSRARQWIWLFIIEEGWVRMVAFPVQWEQHEPCSRFLWEFPWLCRFQTWCIMLLWENVDVWKGNWERGKGSIHKMRCLISSRKAAVQERTEAQS